MTVVKPEWTFLPGDDEPPNELLARFNEEFLAAGPVGWVQRADDFRWLMSSTWLAPYPWKQEGTTCALYLGSALQACGVQARRHVNTKYAITTWLHVAGFREDDPETEYVEGSWIPEEHLPAAGGLIRGDVVYYCSGTSKTWQAAKDGHVRCLLIGSGDRWKIAEGGGGLPLGTCKMSDGLIDIRVSRARPRRGVWRPSLMVQS